QRRRFAAPGRPDHRAELAGLDREADIGERGERGASRGHEPLRDAGQLDPARTVCGCRHSISLRLRIEAEVNVGVSYPWRKCFGDKRRFLITAEFLRLNVAAGGLPRARRPWVGCAP